ncbi:MAG: ribosome biogenesis factor YjgA [Burkholderiales bacterium]
MTTDEGKPSKTQRKREVHELQALGEALVALNAEQLARIELPERLRDAVMEARRITAFEAKRRQLQYIGKLMRGVEAGPIRAALDAALAQSRSEAAAHRHIEGWRGRLLADPGALKELLAEYPSVDARRLRALTLAAVRERAEGRPPRAFHELFQALRALIGRSVSGD